MNSTEDLQTKVSFQSPSTQVSSYSAVFAMFIHSPLGSIDTNLYRNVNIPLLRTLVLYPPEIGAVTQLYAATAEEAGNYGGKVCPCCELRTLNG
jgi:hypothetical protein